MKKTFWSLAVITVMTVYGLAFVNASSDAGKEQDHLSVSAHVHSQGKHCHGTVGCNCPGFSPITNGYVWQQAYCKHCGHKKGYHK